MKNLNLFARVAGTDPVFKLNDLAYLAVFQGLRGDFEDHKKYERQFREILYSLESDEDIARLVNFASSINAAISMTFSDESLAKDT